MEAPRTRWYHILLIALIVLLVCAALLAFNYFFFADRGLELPPTATPLQFVTPLSALALRRPDHSVYSPDVSIPVPPERCTAGLLATAGHSPHPRKKGIGG